MTPNTGPYDPEVVAKSMSALFDRIGDGVLFTHSQSGVGLVDGNPESTGKGHRFLRTIKRICVS
jgi:hypothetical protein